MATIPVLAAFRERNLTVVFTRIVDVADGSDAGVWCETTPRSRELTEDASAFLKQVSQSMLRHRSVDAVSGATASGAVRASVIDAISSNFRLTVVSVCVGDHAIGAHEANPKACS